MPSFVANSRCVRPFRRRAKRSRSPKVIGVVPSGFRFKVNPVSFARLAWICLCAIPNSTHIGIERIVRTLPTLIVFHGYKGVLSNPRQSETPMAGLESRINRVELTVALLCGICLVAYRTQTMYDSGEKMSPGRDCTHFKSLQVAFFV